MGGQRFSALLSTSDRNVGENTGSEQSQHSFLLLGMRPVEALPLLFDARMPSVFLIGWCSTTAHGLWLKPTTAMYHFITFFAFALGTFELIDSSPGSISTFGGEHDANGRN